MTVLPPLSRSDYHSNDRNTMNGKVILFGTRNLFSFDSRPSRLAQVRGLSIVNQWAPFFFLFPFSFPPPPPVPIFSERNSGPVKGRFNQSTSSAHGNTFSFFSFPPLHQFTGRGRIQLYGGFPILPPPFLHFNMENWVGWVGPIFPFFFLPLSLTTPRLFCAEGTNLKRLAPDSWKTTFSPPLPPPLPVAPAIGFVSEKGQTRQTPRPHVIS